MNSIFGPDFTASTSRKWGLLSTLSGLVAFLVFVSLGDPGRGRLAWLSVTVIVLAVRIRWDLKDRGAFWIAVTGIVVAHGLLVFRVPTPGDHYPALLLAPFGLIDLALVFFVFALLDRK
jgi:hypothetical protein